MLTAMEKFSALSSNLRNIACRLQQARGRLWQLAGVDCAGASRNSPRSLVLGFTSEVSLHRPWP